MGAQNAARREKLPKSAGAGKKPLPRPASVKKSSSAAARSAQKADRATPYHHGDLHEALLQAAKRVAERDGFTGLSLRAVAREAGVSHAAPAHHFGDVTGLLSELAAVGFRQFSEQLGAATCSETSGQSVAARKAEAYVAFARDNPCLFQLMFRGERLDHSRPALRDASDAAFIKLASVVAARRHEEVAPDHLTLEQAADIARIWSLVHGFAMLHLDGRLAPIMDGLPPGTTQEALLTAMLMPDSPKK